MTSQLNEIEAGPIGLLLSRRSGSAKRMTGPGPTAAELDVILEAATRVPDHGKLVPWRFIVFEGDGRSRFGDVLAECFCAANPEADDERLRVERERFMRAPVVVGIVSRVREGLPIPTWEQMLSAGACGMTLVLAAHALGYVANWITEWCAYDPCVRAKLGLADNERIAGFIYIGKSAVPLEDRPRPDMRMLVARF
ncbi:MAG TPA: nitroreductase [Rhizomicrobium sp.]|nr:nitroreductase [Rhizomicrobium sp.]